MSRTAPPSQKPWDRRLAHFVMRPLAGSALSPNHVTTVSLLAELAAGFVYAQGGSAIHWGAALYIFSALADHLDGGTSRMSGGRKNVSRGARAEILPSASLLTE